MAPAKRFEDLLVWQKAHRVVLEIYRLTKTFPRHETYGLVAQLQRAAVSVPANIVEGFRKRGKADKLRFLNIAQGSLAESSYYLLLAQDLGYAKTDPLKPDLEEVSRLLDSYVKAIFASVGCVFRRCRSRSERSDAGETIVAELIGIRQVGSVFTVSPP